MENNKTNSEIEIQTTLQKFLGNHKDNYFIIGGHAAAYNLKLEGITFRVTRDYDIVLVSGIQDDSFLIDLVALLESGEYQLGYKSSENKHIAYRFESPKHLEYPEVIEFFVEEGRYNQSLDNRFAKLNIIVNDEKISAMVLNKEIYEFSKNHRIEINELMFVDKPCLIALKAYAYFENIKLYKLHKVYSDAYQKHFRDILRIIGAFTLNEIKTIDDLPKILCDSLKDFLTAIEHAKKQQLKALGLTKEQAIIVLSSLIPTDK